VQLVRNAIEHIDLVKGKVLGRAMKAAQMSDLPDTWVEAKGGRWERMEGRPGERDDEFLIGDLELPYTRETEFGGIKHWIISFNQKVETPLAVGLSSANAERLSKAEMLAIINNPED